jgi:hypothetical protein
MLALVRWSKVTFFTHTKSMWLCTSITILLQNKLNFYLRKQKVLFIVNDSLLTVPSKDLVIGMYSDKQLKKILTETKVIAVVGASRDPFKAAHRIPRFLKERGYKIIPVNPNAEMILGEKTYRYLQDIPEKIDLVNIFRPSNDCLEVAKDAVIVRPKVIWMQLGIKNDEAKKIAEENGIEVIMDKCILIEHQRLLLGPQNPHPDR